MRTGVRGRTAGAPHRGQTAPPAAHHLVVGVGHLADDPARHRAFEVPAAYDRTAGGWLARVAEQNQDAQPARRASWPRDDGRARAFLTAAACSGQAVEFIVATVTREADAGREPQSGVAGADRARAESAVLTTERRDGRGRR